MKKNYENIPNIGHEEKEEIKINNKEIEREPNIKQLKKIRIQTKILKRLKTKNLIITFLLITIFASIYPTILKLFFNPFKPYTFNKGIKNESKYSVIKTQNKIITIGFYDVIHCNRKWRRIKAGYFYELPKYINKFHWIFLAKNGVESKCYNFTHITFRNANNFENLEKAVVENKIDIIVQNEDENLKEHKYLLKLKEKYGIKLVQIMH